MSDNVLLIAIATFRDKIPKDESLVDRILFAMRYVNKHESDVFWMVGNATDDMKMKTALGAVMVTGTEQDRDMIERSLKPLQMISVAAQGIPVDFAAWGMPDDLIPLLGLWSKSKNDPAA